MVEAVDQTLYLEVGLCSDVEAVVCLMFCTCS